MTGHRDKQKTSPLARLRRWFNLGLDADQPDHYQRISRVERKFAEDNMRVMPSVCIGAVAILLLLMFSRCIVHGWEPLNWVPFAVGMLICAACAVQARRSREDPKPWLSICLVDTLSLSWYILAIYANVVLQPDKPSVIMCLMFMAIPLVFDSPPRRTFSMSILAFAAMLWAEGVLVPDTVQHTDLNNAIIAVFVGLGCSRQKAASKVEGLAYLNMFRTATKTTKIVAQVDLLHNSFKALQVPEQMEPFVRNGADGAAQAVDRVADRLIAPEHRDSFLAFLDPTTLSERMGDDKQLTLEYENSDGEWSQLTIVEERRAKGKVCAVVVVVRDIDAEKREQLAYQERLRDAVTEAQRANASKSNFLRRMSHDIRTPINGIRGITKIAARFPGDMAKQAECRQKVLEASDYLLMLVNNVLDMSKLESGAIELEDKPFSLRAILAEVSTLANMQAGDHGVRFIRDVRNEVVEHDRLIGSPVHVRQVLHNLTSNAIKYNREGGSVVLRCQEMACDGQAAQFRIAVEDTGIGMSPEFLAHAFEPFTQEQQQQAHTTYMGSGLGLSIVKEFTESMGGHVEVTSAVGVGTKFTLTIPFKLDTSEPEQAQACEKRESLAGKRALVAEDNDLNREIAEFMLHDLGLEVTLAKNGKEAVDLFAQSEPRAFDVVFMDIMMPVMDGLEAASAIRALDRPDAGTVPILAMTANAFQDDVKRSRDAGMDAHLTKPLEAEKIAEALQRYL